MKRGRPSGIVNKKDKKSYGPLGDLVRKARTNLKMGLSDLAIACDCSVQFISNIEHGRAPLPWDKVVALAKALKLKVDDVQAANLAIRADFKSFVNLSGRKVKKPAVLSEIATSLSLISSDSSLQSILKMYQEASTDSRKLFAKAATELLSQ